MNRFFADTFYWAALLNAKDAAHRKAVEFSRGLRPETLVTSEDVLSEYLTFFCEARPDIRIRAGNSVATLLKSSTLIIPQTHGLFLAGVELYRARPDKHYSLTDCTSMEIMRREGLTDILTNDKHFEQEGFRALFRE